MRFAEGRGPSGAFGFTVMFRFAFFLMVVAAPLGAQQKPYDVFPEAEAPYYRVRYEGSATAGELVYPVNYTIWVPPGASSPGRAGGVVGLEG